MSNILEIKNLSVNFGGIKAVNNISMEVEEGKIVTLIGANGAGKSTILRSVSGIVIPLFYFFRRSLSRRLYTPS